MERGLAKDEEAEEAEAKDDEGSKKTDEDGVRGEGDEVEEGESGWAGEWGEGFVLSMGSSCTGTEPLGSLKEYGATSTEGERYVIVGLRRRVDVGGETT